MASTWQLKQHSRFHSAVLRRLFPSQSQPSEIHQHGAASEQNVYLIHEETSLIEVVDSPGSVPRGTQVSVEEPVKGYEGTEFHVGSKPVKALLSRAQRKRLKVKKSRERKLDKPAKRILGPLRPDLIVKRSNDWAKANVLPQNDSPVKEDVGSSPISDRDFQEKCNGQVSIVQNGDKVEKCMRYQAIPLHSETKEGMTLSGMEQRSLSKAKRRRLAKKKFYETARYPASDSLFTVEIEGENVLIKPIELL